MMNKTPTLLNLNNTTDLFPRFSYQLSSSRQETGMLLSRSERKMKKSCNTNSMKNTEMLDICTCILIIYFSNISVFFIEFVLQLFFFFLSLQEWSSKIKLFQIHFFYITCICSRPYAYLDREYTRTVRPYEYTHMV